MMYDLAVIGGGPGGYVAAIRGAQRGLKVLLVEKDALGGTCVNRGCIPTKCFIYDTKLLETAKTSQALTGTENLSINLGKMVSRKRQVVKRLVRGVEVIVKSHGIDLAAGLGELIAPGRVKVKFSDGTAKTFDMGNVILATGSRPSVLPFIDVDGELIQTTDEALDSEEVPDKMIILGGGVIGVEMATIFLNLGREVTILELLPDILMTEDMEIRRSMRMLMDQHGAKILLNTKALEVSVEGGDVQITYERKGGRVETLRGDRLLVATGRSPMLDGIDPQKLGLKTDGPYIKVNSRLETNLKGVYAIGDLVGGIMLAHKASAEAEAAVANIVGEKREVNPKWVPRCIWGLSEIGAVGITEEEARKTGKKIKIGRFSYLNSGAAWAMGDTNGFVKIIGDKETGEILGVHIMGAHATDLIGDPITALNMEGAIEDLAEGIKPHPTLSETVMEAAMDWSDLVIHSPKKQ